MRAKEFLVEGYQEIEFICVNPKFPEATAKEAQEKLFVGLKSIEGVIVARQDWGDGQVSLAAVYRDPSVEKDILNLAKEHGVAVDLKRAVSGDYVDRILRKELEGQIDEDQLELDEVKAYHGTFRPRLNRFKPLSHFGTEKAAIDRLDQANITKNGDLKSGYIYNVDLNVNNLGKVKDYPELPDPPGNMQKIVLWINDLKRDPRVKSFEGIDPFNHKLANGTEILDHMSHLTHTTYWADWYSPTQWIATFIDLLRAMGIDGLIYKNKIEHPGSWSYITFSPNDVSVLGKPKVVSLAEDQTIKLSSPNTTPAKDVVYSLTINTLLMRN